MSNHISILIIEDESGIADTITYALNTEGFSSHWSATGNDGLYFLANNTVDLLVLDLGLPDINGFDLLKELRKSSTVPVIILTARSDEIDRVLGLELGADDYVVKPFSPRELVSRVKAVLRRAKGQPDSKTMKSAAFFIDARKHIITYFGEALVLSRYEYNILNLLLKHPGWVYSREQIMDSIWEEPEESYERTVDTHIKQLRSKLRAIKPDIDPIVTHRGTGYSLRENL